MRKVIIDPKKIWTISLAFYIISSTAFVYGGLSILYTVARALFFCLSAVNILIKGRFKFNFVLLSIVLYAVVMIVGVQYTPTSMIDVKPRLTMYILMAVAAICLVQYIDSAKDIHTILIAYMIGGLALCLSVYTQYGNEFWRLIREMGKENTEIIYRLDGNLANANTISMCAMISVIIAAYYILFEKPPVISKMLLVCILLFCLVVSMAAASKKSLVAVFISIVAIWIYNAWGTRNVLKRLRTFFVFLVTVLVIVYLMRVLPIFDGVVARFDDFMDMMIHGQGNSSDEFRMRMLQDGLGIWLNHFLFGAGTYSSKFYFGVHSHSNFVELLMNSGIVGFTVFYAPYAAIVWRYMRNAVSYKSKAKVSLLLFALLLSITLSGFAFIYYYDRYYMLLLVTVCGAARVLDTENDSQHEMQPDWLSENKD